MATTLIPTGQDRTIINARIRELEQQLADERSLLIEPVEPEAMHSVIRFRKYDAAYTFAAIRAYNNGAGQGVWFITQDGSRTSRQGHKPKVWSEMLAWIGERNYGLIEVLG